MLSAAKLAAICVPALGLLAAPAAAQERCSGTLCDLYYGNQPEQPAPSQAPAAKTAPTPLMVPSGGGILGFFRSTPGQPSAPGAAPAPSSRPIVGVGGGGLAAMARGEAPERCSGTLCDFYYGGPPPEKSAAAPAAQPAAAVAEAPVEDEPAPPPVRRYVAPEPPRCVSVKDPWSCYRSR